MAVNSIQCPGCTSMVPMRAKFCPKCGRVIDLRPRRPDPPPKVKAPLPMLGILFLAALVAGPAALIAGLAMGSNPLVYAGVVICVLVALFLLLGMFF